MWTQTPEEQWANTTARVMQAQSPERRSGFNTVYPQETGVGEGGWEYSRAGARIRAGSGTPRNTQEDRVCFRFSTALLTQDVFKSSWKEACLSNPWSVLSVYTAYCKTKVRIWGLEGSCVNHHPNRSNQALWKPSEIFRVLWLGAVEDPRGKVHGIVKTVLGAWTWQWCAIWEKTLSAAGRWRRHGGGQAWVDAGRPHRDVKTGILRASSVDALPSGRSLKESGELERR